MPELGELESVPIRSQWPDEARDFTPWLASDGLELLAATIGLPLVLEGTEQSIGPFSADVVCIAGTEDDPRRVVIENQYGRSDHPHLGQLLTYLAGKDAYTAVWIAEEFRDEHVAAVMWLNDNSGPEKSFWALEVQLWRIGQSLPAPAFAVIAAPNEVVKSAADSGQVLSEQRLGRLQFWEGFHQFLAKEQSEVKVSKPVSGSWVTNSIGRTGVYIGLVFTNYDLEHQRFVSDEVTRLEFVFTGPFAVERFDALSPQRETITAQLGLPVPVWYDRSSKDRKIFRQRLWPAGAADREAMYRWLYEQLLAFREIVVPRALELP